MLALLLVLSQLPSQPPGPIVSGVGGSLAQFEFAPTGGKGLPYSADICSAVTPYLASATSYWCTRGDATTLAGAPLTVGTAQGSPVLTTQAVCPNGPDCATKPVIRTPVTTTGYTEAASVDRSASITTGSFTACSEYIYAVTLSGTAAVWQSVGSAPAIFRYHMYSLPGANNVHTDISAAACGGATSDIVGSAVLKPGEHHVQCVTWSASDGIYRQYVDGVADGVSGSSFTTICGGGSSSRFTVTGRWNAGALDLSPDLGPTLGGFYLEASSGSGGQLTAPQLLAISNAVLARGPTGARGEAFSAYTRAGNVGCVNSAGLGGQVPANVPCIAKNGSQHWGSYTVDDLRNEELNNVAWTATATVTANQVVSPNGTLTADQLNDASAVASQGVSQAVTTASLTKHTLRAWVIPGTSSKATCSMTGTGNSAGDCTVSNAAIPAGGALLTCTSPAAYAAGLTAVTISCVVGTVVADTGTINVAFIDHAAAWDGPFPHVPTVAATYTTTADPGLQYTSPVALGPTLCAAASAQFDGDAPVPGNILYLGPVGTSSFGLFRSTSTAAGFDIGGTQTTPVISATGTTVHRAVLRDAAGTRTAFWDNGSVTAPAASMAASQTAIRFGTNPSGTTPCNCTVSRVQLDPSAPRCSAL